MRKSHSSENLQNPKPSPKEDMKISEPSANRHAQGRKNIRPSKGHLRGETLEASIGVETSNVKTENPRTSPFKAQGVLASQSQDPGPSLRRQEKQIKGNALFSTALGTSVLISEDAKRKAAAIFEDFDEMVTGNLEGRNRTCMSETLQNTEAKSSEQEKPVTRKQSLYVEIEGMPDKDGSVNSNNREEIVSRSQSKIAHNEKCKMAGRDTLQSKMQPKNIEDKPVKILNTAPFQIMTASGKPMPISSQANSRAQALFADLTNDEALSTKKELVDSAGVLTEMKESLPAGKQDIDVNATKVSLDHESLQTPKDGLSTSLIKPQMKQSARQGVQKSIAKEDKAQRTPLMSENFTAEGKRCQS